MATSRQQTVGNIGFWLFVPAGVCLLIGWLLHQFVSEKLSIVGMAALSYAIFTLVAFSRNQNRLIRGVLLLVNLAVVLAFGYYQWQALVPATWPSWTPWIGLGLAAAAWLGIMVSVLYRLGRKSQESEETESDHPTDEGQPSAQVTEKIIAALKLASHDGDATVNVGKMIQQLAEWSTVEGRKAAAELANSIMQAVKNGFYEEADMPLVRQVLRKLQGVPEPEKAVQKPEWEEGQPEEFERRSVI